MLAALCVICVSLFLCGACSMLKKQGQQQRLGGGGGLQTALLFAVEDVKLC